MAPAEARKEEPHNEVEELRVRLAEAEETLRAIRRGEVDALVVSGARGDRVFTLQGADHSYRIFLEGMNEGAVTLAGDGTILYANRRFAEIVGTPLESIMGGSIERFVREAEKAALWTVLREGIESAGKGELCLQGGKGEVPVYLAASALLFDDLQAVCLVVTDLTEQKRNEQLAGASQAKDRFLATLSHELRTPLTPVLVVLSQLQEDERLPEDVQGHLTMMRRNVELEARLIDDILDLTRVAQGKIELRREVSDVKQILEHALQTCMGALLQKRLRLVLDLAPEDHRVWADVPRLTQVFWNLLSNAVKFTPPEGTLRVGSSRKDSPSGPWLSVEISDTGIGIEPEALGGVFDAFNQGQHGTARGFGGLGLGLAIAKAIVELHGGRLTASSEGPGRGSTFTVHLPSGLPETPQTAAPSPSLSNPKSEIQNPKSLSILLVEDHPDTAEAIADLLRLQGHRVATAGCIRDALAMAGNRAFDLVLSDLGLPDGNGVELMRELSSRYGLPGIALSGYGMEEDVRQSLAAGFRKHLTKPVNPEVLKAALREIAG